MLEDKEREIQQEMPAEEPGQEEVQENAAEPVQDQSDLVTEAQEWKNRYLRLAADFDNFRKRVSRERSEDQERGREEVLTALLAVCDNFTRALQSAQDSSDYESLFKGVKMIESQLNGLLEQFEVEPIPALHQPFDPNLHHAVMQVENDDFEPETVAGELQVGYQRKGKVLRPSMVQVSYNSQQKQGGQDS